MANTGDRGQIQSSQERIKAPAYGADAGFGTWSPKGDQSPLRGLFGQNWSP